MDVAKRDGPSEHDQAPDRQVVTDADLRDVLKVLQ